MNSRAGQPSPRPAADLERKLDQLPLLPAVVSEVLSLDPEADDYFDRLVHLAERDPPFAIRVLRCANSAFNAPTSPIVSLQHAVQWLGTQQCAGLVLALAVIKVFVPRTEAQRFLWIHSLQTALFAQAFCQRRSGQRLPADAAYLCGLLHDVGRFIQFEGAPEDLGRVDDTHWASPQELVDVERAALGYDHALLGWHACQKWSLPAPIGEVVRRHHEPLSQDPDEPLNLIRVVQRADVLSVALIVHPELAQAPAEELARRLAAEYPSLGAVGEPSEWHALVQTVHDKSMQWARQLKLIQPQYRRAADRTLGQP